MHTISRAKGHPLLGLLPRLRVDPLGTAMHAASLGDIVDLGARHKRMYVLSSPDLVKEVLGGWREFPRGRFSLKPLLGEGLVTTEGPGWQARRRLLQPIFSIEKLDALVPEIGAAVDAMIERWATLPEDRPIDVAGEMNRLSLRIALGTLFGTELDASEERAISAAVEEGLGYINGRMWVAFRTPEWLPLPSKVRFRRARAVIHDAVHRIIQRRRAAGGERDDLLGMMIAARDEGRGATDDELRDEAVTMLIAGHDTIAAGLAWTWHLLARHPRYQDETREESAKLEGAAKLDYARVRELRWAHAIASEAFRLYPPIWMLTRVAKDDCTLGGHAMNKGSVMLVSPYVIHRQAKVWSEPERFSPERFLDKKPNELVKGSYIPFGWGPHLCIGAAFALIQAQLVIAKVNARFRITPADETRTPGARPLVTLRPDGPIEVLARAWSRGSERLAG